MYLLSLLQVFIHTFIGKILLSQSKLFSFAIFFSFHLLLLMLRFQPLNIVPTIRFYHCYSHQHHSLFLSLALLEVSIRKQRRKTTTTRAENE